MATPVTVDEARSRARRRFTAGLPDWVVDDRTAGLDLPLHPPSERAVLADQSAARRWIDSWRSVEGVVWARRAWPSVGSQRVPDRLVLSSAEAVAAFAGRESSAEWRAATGSVRRLLDALVGSEPGRSRADDVGAAVRTHVRRLVSRDDAEIDQIIGVVEWLATNEVAGSRIRHVPLRGVDTKWLARHRAVVESLHRAVTGRASLGLVESVPLVRVRVLDPRLWPVALADASAPAAEWDAVDLAPSRVCIVENLETFLSLPEAPGTIAVHGSGYGVGARVRTITWIRDAPRVVYWGDIDSHGFAILNELRTSVAGATSTLMDEQTLVAHRDLWVEEPKPTHAMLATLTADEAATRARVASEGHVRLEQERIPWSYASERLARSLA